jgi:hypothetical protein
MFIKTPPQIPDTNPALAEWYKDVYNSCSTPVLRMTYTDWHPLATGVWTSAPWNILRTDTHEMYNGGVQYTFTPKVPGYYLLHCEGQVYVDGATMPANTQFLYGFVKNGAGINLREWRNYNAVRTGYEFIPYDSTAIAFFNGTSDNFGFVYYQASGFTWYDFTYGSPHDSGRFLSVHKLPH